jgi:hypothetical protein
MLFKELKIGDVFHDGIFYGMGSNSNLKQVTYFEKISGTKSQVIKCDYSPRQVGSVHCHGVNKTVWPKQKDF